MPVPLGGTAHPQAPKPADALPNQPLRTTSEYALEDVDTVLYALCSDSTTGLSAINANQRVSLYGRNALETAEEESLFMKFVKSIVTNSM
ncbi:hypothetical protein H4S06_002714, partial [Coemansia sp. BCRC 34490]